LLEENFVLRVLVGGVAFGSVAATASSVSLGVPLVVKFGVHVSTPKRR